ncbi:MAG: DUF4494 domain-containing protein [Prevotella sp.]
MRTRTAQWFECRVRYDKQMEDGKQKKVTELYVVDALGFGEAEKRITKEMGKYISGEFEVKTITPAPYGEIFFSSADNDDKYYKAKLAFITIDEKTENEKRTAVTYLCQASSAEEAQKNVKEVMDGTAIDYEITAIIETKILDVFEYNADASGNADNSGRGNGKAKPIDDFE